MTDKLKTEPSKLTTSNRCPDCSAVCRGEKWQSHGRTFEDVTCRACDKSFGRIDNGQWLEMTGLVIPYQVVEKISHKPGVKA